jgi:membrane associated rhomboid family serine protease
MNRIGAPWLRLNYGTANLLRARWPWAVASLILVIQGCVELGGGYDSLLSWLETFGLLRANVLDGAVWQLFTYALLHGGLLHAGVNALCIVLLGARVEHVAGACGFFKTMCWGIVGGGIVHVLLAPGGPLDATLVGISGGCVALLILVTTLSPDSKMWPLPVSGRSLGAGILVTELLLALMHPTLDLPGIGGVGGWLVDVGFGSWFDIGHACHFGGGLAGWMMGRWMLRPRISLKTLQIDRERRERRRR